MHETGRKTNIFKSLTLILYLMHFNEFNGDANDVEDQDHQGCYTWYKTLQYIQLSSVLYHVQNNFKSMPGFL